jgi:hypothetical protein
MVSIEPGGNAVQPCQRQFVRAVGKVELRFFRGPHNAGCQVQGCCGREDLSCRIQLLLEDAAVWALANVLADDLRTQSGTARCELAVLGRTSSDYYYEHVFDAGGELLADVRDEFEWLGGRALFLHDVQVPGPLRRRGYGSVLAADAILTLALHGTAVFAHPGPTDLQSEDPDGVRRLRSEIENTRFLAALRFVPVP